MNKLNKGKLTPRLKSFVDDYLEVNFRHVPVEIPLLNCLVHFSRLIATNHVEVESIVVEGEYNSTPCNIYAMILARSGGFKDVTYKSTEYVVMGGVKNDIKEQYSNARIDFINNLEKEAENLGLDKKERSKYVAIRTPKEYIKDLSKSTFEGFNSVMYSNYAVGVGCTFFRHSEFADILLSSNTDDESLLLSLKEAFDGRVHNKIIKSEDMTLEIDKVPTNALVYSVYDKLIDGDGKISIDDSFSGGMARRFLVAFIPRKIKPAVKTIDSARLERESQNKVINKYGDVFRNMKNMNSNLVCSVEADKELLNYYNDCQARAYTIEGDDILADQIKGRNWIALKLSGIISAFEKPIGDRTVTKEQMQTAIYLVEYFGKQFESFRKLKPKSEGEKLFQVFKKHIGVRLWKKDIQAEVDVRSNDFKKWFDNSIEELDEFLVDTEYELITESEGKNHKTVYTMVEKGSSKVKTAPIEYDNNIPLMVSGIGIDSIDHEKGGVAKLCAKHKAEVKYNKIESKWDNLHEVVTKDSFMPQLNTGTRAKGQYKLVPGGVLMVLDIDHEMTLDKGKEYFRNLGIKSMIITSMSHQSKFSKDDKTTHIENINDEQVEVDNVPEDKYHIFLLLNKPYTGTEEQWKEIYTKLNDDMGGILDMSCSNISRFFYPSVWDDSEYEYIDGEGLDWEAYLDDSEPGRKTLRVKTDASILKEFTPEENVDYYTTKQLGVDHVYEGVSVKGKNGAEIAGRNTYLNNIWKAHFDIGGTGRAERAVRYANGKYCVGSYTDREMDIFLKNKK